MAAGKEQLHFPDLPPSVPAKQMLSAVGQPRLMTIYQQYFEIYGIHIGQDVAHTGCVGFGMERVTLALLKTHGLDPKSWPKQVRETLWP